MTKKLRLNNKKDGLSNSGDYLGMFITVWWFMIPIIIFMWPIYLFLEWYDWIYNVKK